jgi:sugar phosphate isomerase/epimerase
MLQLGFVSAILPDLSFEEVLQFAAQEKFACVEVMCWPKGKAERRYAGVTHIDVVGFSADDAARTQDLLAKYGVGISGLGYYPNPLVADEAEAAVYSGHIKAVISAARLLGVPVVNTFVGRDHTKSIDDNWPRFLATWKPLIQFADDNGIKIGIENCPMSFTKDEWPGGKNLAYSPAIWRRMFNDIPSPNFGLNFDPSHFIIQGMDYVKAIRDFKDRLHHMHAKDVRLDVERLNENGRMELPNSYHKPKLPGQGDVNWGGFLGTLAEIYSGPIAIEVEDRAYEGSLAARKHSLVISANYLRQYIG